MYSKHYQALPIFHELKKHSQSLTFYYFYSRFRYGIFVLFHNNLLLVILLFTNMSRFGPALGGSRLQAYTQAEMSKDLQVYHLTNKHHQDQLYNGMYLYAKTELITLSHQSSIKMTHQWHTTKT